LSSLPELLKYAPIGSRRILMIRSSTIGIRDMPALSRTTTPLHRECFGEEAHAERTGAGWNPRPLHAQTTETER